MEETAILLYGFSQGEIVQLRTLLAPLEQVRVIDVPRAAYGIPLEELLAGKGPTALSFGQKLERKMLVLANAQGPMFHYLLSACKQVTGEQPVLRAMLTETNRRWTGAYLYAHLLEEEAAMSPR